MARALSSLKAWFKATAKARLRLCSGLKAWIRFMLKARNPGPGTETRAGRCSAATAQAHARSQ